MAMSFSRFFIIISVSVRSIIPSSINAFMIRLRCLELVPIKSAVSLSSDRLRAQFCSSHTIDVK